MNLGSGGAPLGGDDGTRPAGNRPANNARKATPGSVRSQPQNAAEEAGDFLGLEQHLSGEAPAQHLMGGEVNVRPGASLPSTPGGGDASWLMGSGTVEHDVGLPPTAEPQEAQAFVTEQLQEAQFAAPYDAPYDAEYTEEEHDEYEEDFEDEHEDEDGVDELDEARNVYAAWRDPESKSSGTGKVMATVIAVAIVGMLGVAGFKLMGVTAPEEATGSEAAVASSAPDERTVAGLSTPVVEPGLNTIEPERTGFTPTGETSLAPAREDITPPTEIAAVEDTTAETTGDETADEATASSDPRAAFESLRGDLPPTGNDYESSSPPAPIIDYGYEEPESDAGFGAATGMETTDDSAEVTSESVAEDTNESTDVMELAGFSRDTTTGEPETGDPIASDPVAGETPSDEVATEQPPTIEEFGYLPLSEYVAMHGAESTEDPESDAETTPEPLDVTGLVAETEEPLETAEDVVPVETVETGVDTVATGTTEETGTDPLEVTSIDDVDDGASTTEVVAEAGEIPTETTESTPLEVALVEEVLDDGTDPVTTEPTVPTTDETAPLEVARVNESAGTQGPTDATVTPEDETELMIAEISEVFETPNTEPLEAVADDSATPVLEIAALEDPATETSADEASTTTDETGEPGTDGTTPSVIIEPRVDVALVELPHQPVQVDAVEVGPELPPEGEMTPASHETALAQVMASRQARTSSLSAEDVILAPTLDAGNLRQATKRDLKGVWNDTAVPLEYVDNPTKVLTPNVGKVRIVLGANDIFEGRLYAVGKGNLWIDGQYGRMGIAGKRVTDVERLASADEAPTLGSTGSQDLAGLERVRVKSPGGVFFGKVISRSDDKITLITDDGARITMNSKDVEFLAETPKVVLKGAKDAKDGRK